jgi:hypothetical protein
MRMSDGFTGGLLSKKDFPVCVPAGRNARETGNFCNLPFRIGRFSRRPLFLNDRGRWPTVASENAVRSRNGQKVEPGVGLCQEKSH